MIFQKVQPDVDVFLTRRQLPQNRRWIMITSNIIVGFSRMYNKKEDNNFQKENEVLSERCLDSVLQFSITK